MSCAPPCVISSKAEKDVSLFDKAFKELAKIRIGLQQVLSADNRWRIRDIQQFGKELIHLKRRVDEAWRIIERQ